MRMSHSPAGHKVAVADSLPAEGDNHHAAEGGTVGHSPAGAGSPAEDIAGVAGADSHQNFGRILACHCVHCLPEEQHASLSK